jgi:predicted nucleic acid-binding Zn ribbon protein
MTKTTKPGKKCPECFTFLPRDAKVCHSCNAKVGEIQNNGFAKKPVDWMSYVKAILAVIIFGVFVWWSFLRPK